MKIIKNIAGYVEGALIGIGFLTVVTIGVLLCHLKDVEIKKF